MFALAFAFFGFQPIARLSQRDYFVSGTAGIGARVPIQKMKMFLYLLSVAGLLAFATTGCEIEGHGGYYGPNEYHSGYYHHDGDHDGYWDRGHYYYRD